MSLCPTVDINMILYNTTTHLLNMDIVYYVLSVISASLSYNLNCDIDIDMDIYIYTLSIHALYRIHPGHPDYSFGGAHHTEATPSVPVLPDGYVPPTQEAWLIELGNGGIETTYRG